MPDMTMPGSSRSDPRSTCRASSGNGSADTSREELGEALVGLPRADLHADLDHGVTLLLRAEDAPISQLCHAIALDEGDLHEAVAGWHVADEECVHEAHGRTDLAVLAVEVDVLATRRVRDV